MVGLGQLCLHQLGQVVETGRGDVLAGQRADRNVLVAPTETTVGVDLEAEVWSSVSATAADT